MDGRTGRDSELVEQAREGDLHAFDRLVARHRARVFGIARQIVSDPDTAQDLAQESLLRAYRSLGSLRNGDRIGQWLNTTVRRLGQEWLRGGRRRPEPVDGAVLLGVPGGFWSPPTTPPTEVVTRVHSALAALSERERRVMILHYLEGRSCDEIAAQLGLHPGSVKRLLHYSRRKARKECDVMTDAEQGRRGPRRLALWTSGEVPQGKWDPHAILDKSLLSQAVCLAINKRPKTAPQIAEEIGVHPGYVADAISALMELETVESPKRNHYLANFIALDAEDWRRVKALMKQPAAEAAHRMAAAEGELHAAFASSPMARSGRKWEEVSWLMYGFLVAQRGVSRALLSPKPEVEPPMRPGGYPYWVGGFEFDESRAHDAMEDLYGVAYYGCDRGEQGVGYFGRMSDQHLQTWIFEPPSFPRTVMFALLDGPLTEAELLEKLGDEPERRRSALARLVEAGLVTRAGERFQLAIPVLTADDSESLLPVIDAVAQPIATEVVAPTWRQLDELLDDMGYRARRDQYAVWYEWLCGFLLGEAVRYLAKQGILPERTESSPPSWSFVAHRGRVPLMGFRGKAGEV